MPLVTRQLTNRVIKRFTFPPPYVFTLSRDIHLSASAANHGRNPKSHSNVLYSLIEGTFAFFFLLSRTITVEGEIQKGVSDTKSKRFSHSFNHFSTRDFFGHIKNPSKKKKLSLDHQTPRTHIRPNRSKERPLHHVNLTRSCSVSTLRTVVTQLNSKHEQQQDDEDGS